MKKTNNKGFSLVELIIVIAIMAILAGAIAPALIRYIDKSRKSNDVSSCKTIKTAVETALGNETIYEYLTTGAAATAGQYCFILISPGEVTSNTTAVTFNGASTTSINGKSSSDLLKLAQTEIGTNIGEKTPKLKYKKAADGTTVPGMYVAAISGKGTVYVFIAPTGTTTLTLNDTSGDITATGAYMICPNICDEYQ